MGNTPTISTNGWRLPQKSHSTAPEATYTDAMYRAKGLPVDPDRVPTTGGSGLPTVHTNDWVLPSTRARLQEEEGPVDRRYTEPLANELEEVEIEENYPSHKRGRVTYLEKVRHGTQPQPQPATVESVRSVQRRLAGLEGSRHLEFATGTPYRRMPENALLETELDPRPGDTHVSLETEFDSYVTESNGKWPRSQMSRGGFGHQTPEEKAYNLVLMAGTTGGGVKDAKAHLKKHKLPFKKFLTHVFDSEVKRLTFGAREGRIPLPEVQRQMMNLKKSAQAFGEFELLLSVAKKYSPKKESAVSSEQAVLAGLTERSLLPHPVTDTRPLVRPRAHGVLDDGVDGGEAYVDQVLADSRWFFEQTGGKRRPFDEAPGGRAGPWRGSDDEPAETPVVRHGKVKGVVGDEPEPEDEKKDQKASPKKKPVPPKAKAKAPPEEEPDEGDEDEEQEEWVEDHFDESESRVGSHLRRAGGRLKSLGQRVRSGRAAQKAKAGLHTHLRKFAKKHGIRAFGHEPSAAPKPKPKAKAAPKPKVKPKVKPKAKPKTKALPKVKPKPKPKAKAAPKPKAKPKAKVAPKSKKEV